MSHLQEELLAALTLDLLPAGDTAPQANRGVFNIFDYSSNQVALDADSTKVKIGSGAAGVDDTSRYTMPAAFSGRRRTEPAPGAPSFVLAPQVSDQTPLVYLLVVRQGSSF